MDYLEFKPSSILKELITCYWIVDGRDLNSQKILPDGFSELILHYGDPYQVSLNNEFRLQPRFIVAGQLTGPIYLQPSGSSGVLGIKFKPGGLWKIWPVNMKLCLNSTVSWKEVLGHEPEKLLDNLKESKTHLARIEAVERFLISQLPNHLPYTITDEIVRLIQQSEGALPIRSICHQLKITPRTVERLFNERIGVSAKSYARITRFLKVFQLLQQPAITKVQAAYVCGFFDQSHFNKEFKKFSGEDPGNYFNQEHAFANFFLNRE